MNRSANERARLEHSIDRMRCLLDALDRALSRESDTIDLAETVMTTAFELAIGIVRHDAYVLAERDAADARQEPMR